MHVMMMAMVTVGIPTVRSRWPLKFWCVRGLQIYIYSDSGSEVPVEEYSKITSDIIDAKIVTVLSSITGTIRAGAEEGCNIELINKASVRPATSQPAIAASSAAVAMPMQPERPFGLCAAGAHMHECIHERLSCADNRGSVAAIGAGGCWPRLRASTSHGHCSYCICIYSVNR